MAPASAALLLLVCLFQATDALETIACPISTGTNRDASLQASDPNGQTFSEISGLSISPSQVTASGLPVMFGMNDGIERRLGVFDTSGQRLMTLRLPYLQETLDFESLAIGSCGNTGEDDTCLYLADFGDNDARLSVGVDTKRNGTPYQILKIREPQIADYTDNGQIPLSDMTILTFDYNHATSPTTFADSEALFLDHTGWGTVGESQQQAQKGDLYFITKWQRNDSYNTRIFYIPALAWPTESGVVSPIYSPEVILNNAPDQLDSSFTKADMTLDGTVIALGGINFTYLWLRCPGQSVMEAIATEHCYRWESVRGDNAKQYETFAWSPDGKENLQMSECNGCDPKMFWSTMDYTGTSGVLCPDVEWTEGTTGWYCRDMVNNSPKDDSWCEARSLNHPEHTTTTPAPSVAASYLTNLPPPTAANVPATVSEMEPTSSPMPTMTGMPSGEPTATGLPTTTPSPREATDSPTTMDSPTTNVPIEFAPNPGESASSSCRTVKLALFLMSCLFMIY